MSMHLEGPWLTTTGKKKGRQKYKSAEQAKLARELEDSWNQLSKKWGLEQQERKRKQALASPALQPQPIYRRITAKPPSLETVHKGAISSKPSPVYTGTKILGIGTLHKSNAVPIFSDQEAVEISRMRR